MKVIKSEPILWIVVPCYNEEEGFQLRLLSFSMKSGILQK